MWIYKSSCVWRISIHIIVNTYTTGCPLYKKNTNLTWHWPVAAMRRQRLVLSVCQTAAPLQPSSLYIPIYLRNKHATNSTCCYEQNQSYICFGVYQSCAKLLITIGCSWCVFSCLLAYRKQPDKPYEVQHHDCEELGSRK